MKSVGLAVAVAAAMILPGLGRLHMKREQELRVALTARTMAEGGSWLVPHYLGAPRLQKPPLMYWWVAQTDRLAGTTTSPFVARLPTAFCGLALVAAAAWGGAWLVGRRRAGLAGVCAAASFLFIRHARLAETDIPSALFIALSLFALYRVFHDPARRMRFAVLAGACSGLAFMTKGLGGFVLPLAAGLVYAFFRRRRHHPASGRSAGPRRRAWLAPLAAGAAVWAVIALPWYAYVRFSPEAAAAVEKAVGSEVAALTWNTGHKGNLLEYVYELPLLLLPWGLLLPAALVRLGRLARRSDGARFALTWFATVFVVLSALPSKQSHYLTLLLLPAALAGGVMLDAGLRRRRDWLGRWTRGYFAGVSGVLALGGVVAALAPVRLRLTVMWPWWLMGAGAILLIAAAHRGDREPRLLFRRRLAAVVVLLFAGMAFYVTAAYDDLEPESLFAGFVREARARLPDGRPVVVAGEHGASMMFYLPQPVVFAPEEGPRAEQLARSVRGGLIRIADGRDADARVPETGAVVRRARGDLRLGLYCVPAVSPASAGGTAQKAGSSPAE